MLEPNLDIMKMIRLTLLFAFLLLILSIKTQSQIKPAYDFENHIKDWQMDFKVPAVGIGVIENGTVVYVKTFGEIKKGVPADKNTIFPIASLTKTMVALLTLKLIESKQLKLDEPVYKYHLDNDIVDDIRYKGLTTKHILSHQTGFVNWRNMSPSKKLSFNFKPGESYGYSGEGYEYLRHVIENKIGKKIEILCDSMLFKPIGIKETKFYWDGSFKESRIAVRHDEKGNEYGLLKSDRASAASGILTTVKDYSEFCSYVLNRGGLSDELFNEMVAPQVKEKDGIDYGLGWEIVRNLSEGEYAIMHGGSESGVKTFVVLLPKSRRGIVVFTNSDNGYLIYEQVISSYLKDGKKIFELMNKKFIPKVKFSLLAEHFSEYIGSYEIKPGVRLDIIRNETDLMLKIPGQPLFNLYAQSENEFLIDKELMIQFIRNQSNNIISVIIYQNGIRAYSGSRL
jgi:CubicO group peptidase (beta-lactamase class C family)